MIRKTKWVIAPAHALCLAALLSISTARAEMSCATTDAAMPDSPSPVAIDLIEDRIRAGEVSCAEEMVHSRARALAAVTGPAGIDARFALRELALAVVENGSLPSAERMRIARQAAGTIDGPANSPKEEVQADARFLVLVTRRFLSERDLAAWLDALELAIRLDQRLAETDRRLQSWELSTDPFSEAGRRREYARLAKLAALTHGDRVLAGMRSDLAATAYFHGNPWDEKAGREEVLRGCGDLLILVDRLYDVTNCSGCVKEWRWRPIFNVGIAYHRLGMADKAKGVIDQALAIVHGIEDPDYRLGQMRFVLADLLGFRYDGSVVLKIAREMKNLSESSNTPMAREVRKNLPETMKRGGFNDFR